MEQEVKRKRGRPRKNPPATLPTFADKYEEELKKKLFQDVTVSKTEDEEESPYYEFPKEGHRKRNGAWDVPLDEEILYFDPELSYELTGYRPINETQGLDFDPTPFAEAGRLFMERGHYTEYPKNSKPYRDYWTEQYKRCVDGYTVGKYRITGDHYFFLNFYRMKTVDGEKKAGAGRTEAFPTFFAKQYEYFHYLEMCEYLYKDCVALKSRGVGFSEIGACLGVRPFITTKGFTTIYTAYTESYVDTVLGKCWVQLNWLNQNTDGGMKRLRQKIDNIKHKRASLVDSEGIEFGRMADIEGITADHPRKIRGERVDRLLFEEAGSNPILSTSWTQGTALVELGGARVGIKIAWGTGGDMGPALAGLAKMFEDPLSAGVLPYKNFYSDDGTAQYTGFFIPAYEFMMRPGYVDNRGVTDTKRAKAFYEEQRKLKSGERLLEYCSEYCFTPKEALLRQGENIFDSVLIADRITQIRVHKMGTSPQHIALLWDREDNDNSRNKVKAVSSPNSKILVYEEPKRDSEGNIYNNLYVAGIDSIDQGTGDSATQYDVSDFCIVVKRRVFGLNEPKYVCIYKDRPRDIREAYENAMKILVWYNCKALLEHTKISILTYFREKKKDSLFMRRPKSSLGDIKKGNSAMIGVPATETIIKHGLELINNFVNDYCYGIDSDEMLEQLLNYSYENKRKFDIVAALGMCEMADEELTGINPKVKNEVTKTWKDIGWYIDDRGYKRYGIIPTTWHN